ncbi:hypothetical protein ACQ4PT_029552 [Festuca glaucescens]
MARRHELARRLESLAAREVELVAAFCEGEQCASLAELSAAQERRRRGVPRQRGQAAPAPRRVGEVRDRRRQDQVRHRGPVFTSTPCGAARSSSARTRRSLSRPTPARTRRRRPRACWCSERQRGLRTTTYRCALLTWTPSGGSRAGSASAAAGSGPCRRWGSSTATVARRSRATCSPRRVSAPGRCRTW